MTKILISLAVVSIILLASLPAPAKAAWGWRYPDETYGQLWDCRYSYYLGYEGIYGETYVSYQDPDGWLFKEFVAIIDAQLEYWFFRPTAWITVGYYHYDTNTPTRMVRWKLGDADIIHGTTHGYASWDTYQDNFIWKSGSYWDVYINGGRVTRITFPTYHCAILAEISNSNSFGDIYGWFTNLKQFDSPYWEYWDYQTRSWNDDVVVYIVNEHTFGTYRDW